MIRKGGTAVMVGMTRAEAQVTIPTFDLFFNEKTLKGCKYGSGQVRRDFQRFADLIETGRLDTVVDGVAHDRARRGQRRVPRDGDRAKSSAASSPPSDRMRRDVRSADGAGCAHVAREARGRNGRSSVAYVMAATGEAVTYRELNDRSNQLAQCSTTPGCGSATTSRCSWRTGPSTSRCAGPRSARASSTRASTRTSTPTRPRTSSTTATREVLVDLRHVPRASRPSSSTRCRTCKLRLMVGDDASTATSRTRTRCDRYPGRAARRGARRHADALLVGHDGPAEGRASTRSTRQRVGEQPARDGDDDHGLGHGRATPCTSRPRRCTTPRRSSTA